MSRRGNTIGSIIDLGSVPADGDMFVAGGGRLSLQAFPGLFGDGSDGDVTISGSVVLARDMFYNNLTIAAGAALNTNGWRVFIAGVLDLQNAPTNGISVPRNSGVAAVAGAGGVAAGQLSARTAQNSDAPTAGIGGGSAAGNAGTGNAVAGGYAGGNPGAGGVGGTGSGGAGGAAGARNIAGANVVPRYVNAILTGINSAVGLKGGVNGPAGGSGGGDGTPGGGSGGGASGGGIVMILARRILRSSANANTGVISAQGGHGGNGGVPSAGNRGGGGGSPGGGGGFLYIVCGGLAGTTHTNALDVSGGNGGSGGAGTGTGTAGAGAQAGLGGRAMVIMLSGNTYASYDGTAVGGNAAVGATGGTATAAQANL